MTDYNSNRQVSDNGRSKGDEQRNPQTFSRIQRRSRGAEKRRIGKCRADTMRSDERKGK